VVWPLRERFRTLIGVQRDGERLSNKIAAACPCGSALAIDFPRQVRF